MGASSAPSGTFALHVAHPQITGTAFGGQQVLVLRRLVSLHPKSPGLQVALASLLPPVPLSYTACPCRLLVCQAGLTQCTSRGNTLFRRVRCPVSPHRQCLRKCLIHLNLCLLPGKPGHKKMDTHQVKQEHRRWAWIRILPKTPQPRKHPSVLLRLFQSECHSLHLLFFVNISCNHFVVLNTLRNRN